MLPHIMPRRPIRVSLSGGRLAGELSDPIGRVGAAFFPVLPGREGARDGERYPGESGRAVLLAGEPPGSVPDRVDMVAVMATAHFRDLVMDAVDPVRLSAFWAAAAGLTAGKDDLERPGAGDMVLRGPTRQHVIWVNRVAEAKAAKHRVHLDVYARQLADLEALGAVVLEPEPPTGERGWTVMTDPEGGEFCAFLHDDLPAYRIHGLVVDCADAVAQARWWGEVYGADLTVHPGDWATLENIPGFPILTMDFNPVPEPRTVKNRVHWDVSTPDLQPLLDAGAKLLRPADDEVRWDLLADPEGNEFCAFVGAAAADLE